MRIVTFTREEVQGDRAVAPCRRLRVSPRQCRAATRLRWTAGSSLRRQHLAKHAHRIPAEDLRNRRLRNPRVEHSLRDDAHATRVEARGDGTVEIRSEADVVVTNEVDGVLDRIS